MVVSSACRFASRYRPAPLARLPPQLDPNAYQWSPEKLRAEAERVALRSRVKRDFLMRLNDPRRTEILEDAAVIRWDYARRQNVYPSHRFTPKSSLLSLLWGAGPFIFWYYVLKTNRDVSTRRSISQKTQQFQKKKQESSSTTYNAYKERLKSEGRYDEGFRTSY